MTGRFDYDEFGLFHENGAKYGVPWNAPDQGRRQKNRAAPATFRPGWSMNSRPVISSEGFGAR